MRELPQLQTICARALGAPSCSVEVAFSKLESGEPTLASRLLRSFQSTQHIPKPRPCIGPGSSRRDNAHDVDLMHPFIADRKGEEDDDVYDPELILQQPLLMQYGNPSLDSLQAYIDALVELGRMDDSRLGVNFFTEWKTNVVLQSSRTSSNGTTESSENRHSKKRRIQEHTVLGSLSLHNCTIADNTIEAFLKVGVGSNLAVLDLTGIRGLTDDLVVKILATTTERLERLSLKNCRKLTHRALRACGEQQNLQCLDIGGCFNMTAHDVLTTLVPSTPSLSELHASGLQWSDETVRQLVQLRATWTGLSLGFSKALTQASLRESLLPLASTLEVLALPFCEFVVDNALLGILGRNMPKIRALDLRGNHTLSTVTGFYDGRVSADHAVDRPLVILGRYSGVTPQSVEETKRNHPKCNLAVILDGGGMGAGILRRNRR